MRTVKDKVIWVTGASSGIGKELALQLAVMGAKLILTARNEAALEQIKQQVSFPDRIALLPMDLTQMERIPAMTEKALTFFGGLDALINNAGVSQRSIAIDTDLEVHRKLMEINYFATVALTKAVLPVFQNQKHGHIAVTSSLAGKFGFYQRSAYAASKFALHGFFETLRLEEEDNKLKVTIWCPGGIKTNISAHALDGEGKAYGKMSALQEEGMPADQCAKHMIEALIQEKEEVVIGEGLQKISTRIKGIFPTLFWKMLKRNKPADM
jgi:short-subunit dehydrogenase